MKGSDRLREWREGKGLSKAECARRVGVSTPTWWDWEEGKKRPRVTFAVRIAELTRGAVPVAAWVNPEIPRGTKPSSPSPKRKAA